jgi:predicted acetyltransferase
VEAVEIGAVREDELASLLRLMSEAFHLNYHSAREIFLADPYFDLENKRVLRIQGQLVSCLTLVEAQCWLGHSVVRLAGVAGVATLPSEQRRGYAGLLLQDTLRLMAKRGYALSALLPFSREYYRKFGWELGSTICRHQLLPSHLLLYPERKNLRPATPEDIPALSKIYNSQTQGHTLQCLRDTTRWQYVLALVKQSLVYDSPTDGVTGYLLYEFRQSEEEKGLPLLRVLEQNATTGEAERGLYGFLAQQERASLIEWDTGVPTYLQDHLEHTESAVPGIAFVSGMMTRIVCMKVVLEALRERWGTFQGKVALVVSDPLLHDEPMAFLVSGDGKECRIASLPLSEANALEHRLEGEVGAWSQVLTGFRSGSSACALGLLTSSSPLAAEYAGALFRRSAPFLSPVDHF